MSEPIPDFNRIITTLHHQEPNRVPLAEAIVDCTIMSQFLGCPVTDENLPAQVEFWARAGYDYIPLTVGMMRPGGVTKDSQISRVIQNTLLKGGAEEEDPEAWNIWKKARIYTEEDLEAFPWQAAAQLDLSKFYGVQPHLPPGMKIIAMSGKIFTLSWMLMGFENFAVNSLLQPEFVKRVVEKVARIQLDGLRQVAHIPNVAAVWAVDDIAYGSGPIVSPRTLREIIFPWYEEFCSTCREHGLYVFFHTDGVLWDLFEDLIHLGVQALHPIDPTCMDIEEVKQKVGDRLCLLGNIPNELLADGTPEEVEALTKARLRKVAPGGGYCLGSGNSVPDWARFENYQAMIRTALTCGRYPIHIE
jgi:uroporphyrinogen decarboxylase